jgi:hypothetical protein
MQKNKQLSLLHNILCFSITQDIVECLYLRVSSYKERNIIPNDTKLFAQADSEKTVEFYLSSDKESLKIYNLLKLKTSINFNFLDLNKPFTELF